MKYKKWQVLKFSTKTLMHMYGTIYDYSNIRIIFAILLMNGHKIEFEWVKEFTRKLLLFISYKFVIRFLAITI